MQIMEILILQHSSSISYFVLWRYNYYSRQSVLSDLQTINWLSCEK